MHHLPICGVEFEAKTLNSRRFVADSCTQHDENLLSGSRSLQKISVSRWTHRWYEILQGSHGLCVRVDWSVLLKQVGYKCFGNVRGSVVSVAMRVLYLLDFPAVPASERFKNAEQRQLFAIHPVVFIYV